MCLRGERGVGPSDDTFTIGACDGANTITNHESQTTNITVSGRRKEVWLGVANVSAYANTVTLEDSFRVVGVCAR